MATDRELLIFCDLLNLDVEYMDVLKKNERGEETGEYHTASTLIEGELKTWDKIEEHYNKVRNIIDGLHSRYELNTVESAKKFSQDTGLEDLAIPIGKSNQNIPDKMNMIHEATNNDWDEAIRDDKKNDNLLEYRGKTAKTFVYQSNSEQKLRDVANLDMKNSAKLFMDYYDGKEERPNCFLDKWTVKDTGNEYLLCKKLYMSIIDKDIDTINKNPFLGLSAH